MFNKIRGELETAHKLTERLVTLAQNLQDPALIVEASFAMGSLLYYSGEHGQSQEYLEQGINSYDPEQHQYLALHDDQDPGVAMLCYASINNWLLGYPDRAMERCSETLALAEELSHPYSLAMALIFISWTNLFRRDRETVLEQAKRAIRLSEEHDFPIFAAVGRLYRGWAVAEQGNLDEVIIQMQQALRDVALAMGSEDAVANAGNMLLLADTYGKAGQPDEGLQVLAEAIPQVDKNRQQILEPELYRLKGELLLLRGEPESEVEANFQRAIEIARQQGTRSLELRAATSLARLWQSQGKQEEARQILGAIYSWFTEGFDTLDLIEAKALLDELS